jgi:hypothetical protein
MNDEIYEALKSIASGIEALFEKEVKVTILIRMPSVDDSLLVTNDDMKEISESIDYLRTRGPEMPIGETLQ